MSAREHFGQGIIELGVGENTAALRSFREATTTDPNMCDAWMGMAVAGDTSLATLRGAYESVDNLHRETRGIGLEDTALAPTVHTPFLIDYCPYTPGGVALAYAATLLVAREYSEAEKILDTVELDTEHDIHRYLGATMHYLSGRWPDVITWTTKPVPVVGDIIADATRLLAGIAQTHLAQFSAALVTFDAMTGLVTPETGANAALYRGLCQRRLGNEGAARQEFGRAVIDGELLTAAAAALADPTYGPVTTTPEAIAARTSKWDPESGPSAEELQRAHQHQQAQGVLKHADDELEEYIGLDHVKKLVHELKLAAVYDKKMQERGEEADDQGTKNLTVVGPTGTAKTSIARLLGKMYFGIGILESDQFIEVKRQHLVGQHIGDTEAKTKEWLEKAVGRVLFVDEVHELYKPGVKQDFGHIALDQIMGWAETHRHDTMIVLAGYPGAMDAVMDSNPGMRRRFPTQLEFTSVGAEDLVKIVKLFAKRAKRIIDEKALEDFADVAQWLCAVPEGGAPLIDTAGNGGFARNVIEKATGKAKVRLAGDQELDLLTADLEVVRTISPEDMRSALDETLAAAGIRVSST